MYKVLFASSAIGFAAYLNPINEVLFSLILKPNSKESISHVNSL